MTIDVFLYYTFSIIALLSALMVIQLSNAIYSVLFLILTFCNVACLLLLLGAEFYALLLLIVYVGAIAVLFLFIVMMLNIKIKTPIKQLTFMLPLGLFLTIVFAYIFNIALSQLDLLTSFNNNLYWLSWQIESLNVTNIEVLGNVLYTDFSLLFVIASLLLLVAMIGVIVLTMHQRIDSKKQKLELQLTRNPKGSIKFMHLRN